MYEREQPPCKFIDVQVCAIPLEHRSETVQLTVQIPNGSNYSRKDAEEWTLRSADVVLGDVAALCPVNV